MKFVPLFRGRKKASFHAHTGPILTVGGKKIDEAKTGRYKDVLRIRAAFSPEFYSDFLFGKSEGIDSTRFEARGQIPIPRTGDRSRVVLGAVGNFALGDSIRTRFFVCTTKAANCQHPNLYASFSVKECRAGESTLSL